MFIVIVTSFIFSKFAKFMTFERWLSIHGSLLETHVNGTPVHTGVYYLFLSKIKKKVRV